MRGSVRIEPGYEDLLTFIDPDRPFESISEYFGFPLGKDQRRRSKVARREVCLANGEKVTLYFKLYGYRRLKRALSRIFKPTRSQSEIANLKFFHQWGIPACEPILQGVYRNAFGISRNCMLITREVTGSQQLDHFLPALEASADPADVIKHIREQILTSLAKNLRKIHDQKFYHDDFKARNILVRRAGDDGNAVEIFWIDCPNGYFDRLGGARSKHGMIKDLATLDYDARKLCSSEERFRFLSIYSGLDPDSAELHELADQVVDYRKLKIDDDRPGR